VLLSSVDTIAAIATAQGRGGVGIVRISGFGVPAMAQALLGQVPPPRVATYCAFPDHDGQIIDQGIALYFVAPHSYTGEPVLELQGHGGPAVLQLVLKRCLALGARLAEPGEFTQRAFLNNKLDLAQAESVADLIEATTAEAASSAMRSLRGEFSNQIQSLVNELISLRMYIEAMLDFPEEDLDLVDTSRCDLQLEQIQDRLDKTLNSAKQGSLLREGAHVVLIGRPNVGKSSLLNRLSGQSVALVSDVPGTTRDLIRQEIQIRGVPFHIIDTAGLRESSDAIEKMGIALTHQTIQQADLILLLLDSSQNITADDEAILAKLPIATPRLKVFNKCDLFLRPSTVNADNIVHISAKTGDGVDVLCEALLTLVGWKNQDNSVFMARTRHLTALNVAQAHLQQAKRVRQLPEVCAEELRLVQEALSSITGKFSADDLLGEIFSRFCIGK
jgi:tRNA modification GTPase